MKYGKCLLTAGVLILIGIASIGAAQPQAQIIKEGETQSIIMIGVLLAIVITGIASAFGVGLAGSAAVAVTAEKPELFGKTLVLQILPMTQCIYGFLGALFLMMGGGILAEPGPGVDLTNPMFGKAAILIGLIVGITGISAIAQYITVSASIASVARNPDVFGRGMMYSVMSEFIAIIGLLTAILLMSGLGFL
jgi:V/A-type H+-transporting ATPase subunit K